MNPLGNAIGRTIFLVIALVNQLLSAFHYSPINLAIDETELAGALSLLITGIASIAAWWKNNSFTKAAKKADEVLKMEKEKGAEKNGEL